MIATQSKELTKLTQLKPTIKPTEDNLVFDKACEKSQNSEPATWATDRI